MRVQQHNGNDNVYFHELYELEVYYRPEKSHFDCIIIIKLYINTLCQWNKSTKRILYFTRTQEILIRNSSIKHYDLLNC